jgi:hypothetical protein
VKEKLRTEEKLENLRGPNAVSDFLSVRKIPIQPYKEIGQVTDVIPLVKQALREDRELLDKVQEHVVK